MIDKKNDTYAQRELLGGLVRTLENEHHLMETLVKDEATRAILELQREMLEPKCPEMEEECRLGLGKQLDCLVLLLLQLQK